ncbi:hypothetical protein OEA41_003264 [Lepraria neglecta]|uniref:Cytochrome P450 n=1 Tax=Lepraria neglecta TaxID=209136 RepID=A0AAD9Z4D1_9LECA|nr:hypothetical protein OEA41_003264 [Lepraria neglecta]
MDGYNKYKDLTFWIRSNDRDILILSNKYVDELRAIPEEKLSGTEAQLENLRGPYYMDVAIRSTLHTRSLNQTMSPNIQAYVDIVRDELAYAMLVSRQDSLWDCHSAGMRNDFEPRGILELNVFTTVLILREFPPFLRPLHPIIVRCLPSWHIMRANFSIARRLIAPVLEQHASKKPSGKTNDDGRASPLPTLMADNGSNDLERDPVNLAHRIHAMLDLKARPKVLESLRDELEKVITTGGWRKLNLLELWKLNSFMSESQRINPPALTVFHHLVMEPLTLSDGTYLPKGTFIAIAAASTPFDPEVTPDPETFDAFRSYRKRLEPDESTRHQYAMVDKDHTHFGHGLFLLNYDLKYPEGKGRPVNKTVDEFIFADPTATVLIKKRKDRNIAVPELTS